jgi:molybdopterin-guanine dinucleotide biosynthesis protein A
MNPILHMTAAILAGGASSRMGRDKAFAEVGGVPLIRRQLALARRVFSCVVICANDEARFAPLGAPVLKDEGGPGRGPLGALAAAARAAPTQHIFCCAVDMPFLSEPLIRYMASLAPGHDAVVPAGERDGAALEPLCAIYRRSCLEPFRRRLADGELALAEALAGLRVRLVRPGEVAVFDPARASFRNVNTPEELAAAARELEARAERSRA